MSVYHTPVLLQESVSALCINPAGVYVDATFGGGGHSAAILAQLGSKGRLIAIDRDEDALANVPDDKRVTAVHGNFRFIHNFIRYEGYDAVDGILADLGVSSHQFDTEERGFSFRFDSDLDMRMNPQAPKDAKLVLNSYSCEDLERIFRVYGEVEHSRKIAELVCKKREHSPIRTTSELGSALETVLPKFSEHKFLAKVYQALRIEVNDEMSSLEKFMPMAIKSLKEGGILAVITYHSLEDRIVKNAIRDEISSGILEKAVRKPVVPTEEEISQNTRARSAKLRVARKKVA
ncbi:MAG: 16S rRNA (cytosine(1402)-N(4))-methyltransferase RsmH [Bacteroidales bacterium]|jgi:16S rRNA (cytosine1402-N4)-methyltransferase|nr:16S rRNA (cytosine(1402)-N(4))-methyltransferase RsmH [Bacteroidales bacterium]